MAHFIGSAGTILVITVEKPPQENYEGFEPQAQQGNGVGNQNELLEIVVANPLLVVPKVVDPELTERVQILEQKTSGFLELDMVQVLEEKRKQFAEIERVEILEQKISGFIEVGRVDQLLEEKTSGFVKRVQVLEETTKQFADIGRVEALEKKPNQFEEVEAAEAARKELREVVYQFCQCLFPSTAGIIGGLWLSMPCGFGGILAVILVALVTFLLGAISAYKMWVAYGDYKTRKAGSGFWEWWGLAWPYVAHLVLIVVAATILAVLIGEKAYKNQCIIGKKASAPEPSTLDLQGFVKDM